MIQSQSPTFTFLIHFIFRLNGSSGVVGNLFYSKSFWLVPIILWSILTVTSILRNIGFWIGTYRVLRTTFYKYTRKSPGSRRNFQHYDLLRSCEGFLPSQNGKDSKDFNIVYRNYRILFGLCSLQLIVPSKLMSLKSGRSFHLPSIIKTELHIWFK